MGGSGCSVFPVKGSSGCWEKANYELDNTACSAEPLTSPGWAF
jgi:hypothetical protein